MSAPALRSPVRGARPSWTLPAPAPLTAQVKDRALTLTCEQMRTEPDGWLGLLHHPDGTVTCHGGRRGQQGAVNAAASVIHAQGYDRSVRILLGRSYKGRTELCDSAGRPLALRA